MFFKILIYSDFFAKKNFVHLIHFFIFVIM